MEDMPANVQQQIAQFQMMQQQAQAVSSQKVQMELQLKEMEHSISELKKLKKDAEVYESIGAILIKKSKTKITTDLKERKETLELRIKTLTKQEKDVQAKLMEMQTEIQKSLKSGGPKAG
jgi:prefoldin beta subunit